MQVNWHFVHLNTHFEQKHTFASILHLTHKGMLIEEPFLYVQKDVSCIHFATKSVGVFLYELRTMAAVVSV